MTAAATDAFDLADPLPRHTLVLEASAGTGKTYAIVALAVRYIADGTPVSALLMATFSNAASAELRDRTHARLTECVAALADPDSARASDDELIAVLADTDAPGLQRRRDRLADALSDFDAATVATTHTFCNRMLAALGFLGGRQQQFPILENVDEMVAELARDAYLARFAGDPDSAPPYADAEKIAIAAVRDPAATLAPDREDERSEESDIRVWIAEQARKHTAVRKRLARVRTYDDLQQTLFEIVTDPIIGDEACRRIREQFAVVLIDEFQDTDPQQWEIVRRCFHTHLPLVLVGDPKQSIYAFRGAEVLSYLNAVESAGEQRRLATNWRSDGAVVDGLGVLFDGAALGHPQIGYHPVTARHEGSRIHGAPAVRIRAFLRGDFKTSTKDGTAPLVPEVRERVTEDVADDIAALLGSETTIDVDGRRRPVQPGDIAILLRANKTIAPLQQALAERGVASVVTSGTSIYATPAARFWWYVLSAIESPSRQPRVRLAALTPLIGMSAQTLERQGDTGVGTLSGQLAELGRIFVDGGFAPMAARLFGEFDTAARLLRLDDGERLMTDLLQLSELCNRRAVDTAGGVTSLVEWLGKQIDEASGWGQQRDATRRLDRDTEAVQIMTVHASKGLEFPIVYVPFGWDGASHPNPATFLFHEGDDKRYLDVGGKQARGYHRRDRRSRTESAGEDLRLLYVATTRARSQVVLWWTPSTTTPRGALHRLLFTAGDRRTAAAAGTVSPIPDTVPTPGDDTACVAELRGIAAHSSSMVVEPAGRTGRVEWRASANRDAAPVLDVSRFGRVIDKQWRRTSYSAIVAAAHAAVHAQAPQPASLVQAGSEPEDVHRPDEPDDAGAGTSDVDIHAGEGMPSLMNGLPYGAGFGTLVHEVLEHVDTSARDLEAHVLDRCRQGAVVAGVDIDVDVLARALVGVLTTPLGFGDLWSVKPKDRLAEMDFELPLSAAAGGFGLDAVGDLLAEHLPPDDPLARYADLVRSVSKERFSGFLTGSIDSILRTADGRFTVVDYKTNRLRAGDLAVEDFHREAMADEMMAAHYPLQALLYSVALHRYLRWRVPDYAPATHLGPVQYHFVRGMAGPSTPPGCGVFQWDLPPVLVVGMSELLAGRSEGSAR
ncbi:UvrD-helicase domain-containing protein [Gordonia sp. (in: high G+C Gram-positive bacteria)]|uniref:UvrD-helicase domain-containing protein n=1 Tax=Gordonia sp. (in: high G+C Gram-positive bacteria) TaxID=84139 RepID=UPI001699B283|nr:UvrD-helicase domain-containing protein [Gordonia sp. (in: high G+C Gram-positive bacteria)]NLG46340.1 UvrD-helicase domain-containing protein [Gordonia sp. (in: high G+C Gram-positive bacteria)]